MKTPWACRALDATLQHTNYVYTGYNQFDTQTFYEERILIMSDKNQDKAKNIVKEMIDAEMKDLKVDIKAKAEKFEADNAKVLEENKTLKAQLDSLQGKTLKMANNGGGETEYVFRGYNTQNPSRNFQVKCTTSEAKEVREALVKAIGGSTQASYSIPEKYGNSLLGLAELQSFALQHARVIKFPGEIMKLPTKATRGSVDAQAFGSSNTGASTALGQLTWTIDKRVGAYEQVYNNILKLSNFDVLGDFVEPMISEAIGQNLDSEMFGADSSGSFEFTGSVLGGGTVGHDLDVGAGYGAGDITFAAINDVEFALEIERGLGNPVWCLPRAAMKQIASLRADAVTAGDGKGAPLFDRKLSDKTPYNINGYPVYIVPAIGAAPEDDDLIATLLDPKHYILAVNTNMVIQINPWVEMKEGITQIIGYITADGQLDASTAASNLVCNVTS